MAFAIRPAVIPVAVSPFLHSAAVCFRSPAFGFTPPLRFGVDLGTATIVLTAVDAADRPVYYDVAPCAAVRDGVVVDFAGAARHVGALKLRAQESLRSRIEAAATAFPPGIAVVDARACRYVLERAGIACRELVDEVSAAQALLSIDDGVVVDVGGGSTGVGVVRNGRLIQLSDAPGGGHHLDLIIAGALHISIEAAEVLKRTSPGDIEDIVAPGIERIAESIKRQAGDEALTTVHLVGGALMLPDAAEHISRYLGVPTIAYPHADLITPFGMALYNG